MNNNFKTEDSGERKVYKTGMERDTDKNKPRFDLCWKPLYWRWAELMARGAEKYGANNWQKAATQEELDRFRASAERHLQQWLRYDEGEDHAAAVIFNIAGAEFVRLKMVEDLWCKPFTEDECKVLDHYGEECGPECIVCK